MSRKNKSYLAELKYQAVEDYLRGESSQREICKKYGIRSKCQLQDWIKLYNGHKELKCHTGGSRMTKGRDTTYEEQITLVQECIFNETSNFLNCAVPSLTAAKNLHFVPHLLY